MGLIRHFFRMFSGGSAPPRFSSRDLDLRQVAWEAHRFSKLESALLGKVDQLQGRLGTVEESHKNLANETRQRLHAIDASLITGGQEREALMRFADAMASHAERMDTLEEWEAVAELELADHAERLNALEQAPPPAPAPAPPPAPAVGVWGAGWVARVFWGGG
jgi:hypothetical protein